jgi:hypothetical protein
MFWPFLAIARYIKSQNALRNKNCNSNFQLQNKTLFFTVAKVSLKKKSIFLI